MDQKITAAAQSGGLLDAVSDIRFRVAVNGITNHKPGNNYRKRRCGFGASDRTELSEEYGY